MKIVINICLGGFGLSQRAVLRYAELKGIELTLICEEHAALTGPTYSFVPEAERLTDVGFYAMSRDERIAHNARCAEQTLTPREIPRNDPDLVRVVEELGNEANGRFANLKVVDIPDGIDWEIDEYDGDETVKEAHRSWS